jgi:hypothetical protein
VQEMSVDPLLRAATSVLPPLMSTTRTPTS